MRNDRPFSATVKQILLTTLIAGTLDLTSVWLIYGPLMHKSSMERILRGVASGVFGKDAYAGGNEMMAYGVVFHYIIACCFTIAYFLLYPRMVFFQRRVVLSGLLYGIFAWVWMNLLVLPMTNVTRLPFKLQGVLIGAGLLMCCIGLPIALLTNAYYKKEKTGVLTHEPYAL